MGTAAGFKVDAAHPYTLAKMLIMLEEPRLFRQLEEIEEKLRASGTSWIGEAQRSRNEYTVYVGGDGRRLVLSTSGRRIVVQRLEDPHAVGTDSVAALERLLQAVDAKEMPAPARVNSEPPPLTRPDPPRRKTPDVPPVVQANNDALGRLMQAVSRWPGSSARELALQMRGNGLGDVTKQDINPLLYRHKDLFGSVGDTPPRWRLADGSAPASTATTDLTRQQQKTERKATFKKRDEGTYAHLLTASATQTSAARVPPPAHRRIAARPLGPLVLPLFTWQERAIQSWYEAGCVGIEEAVTGTGKTHVGMEAVAQAHRDGEKSVIFVPSVELQRQWTRRIVENLPHLRIARVGGEAAREPAKCDVTIAVVNSASKKDLSKLSADSLLVADEVHRYGAETFAMALRLGFKRRLGLTATLERADDAVDDVIRPYFGATVLTYGFRAAIDEDVVAPSGSSSLRLR